MSLSTDLVSPVVSLRGETTSQQAALTLQGLQASPMYWPNPWLPSDDHTIDQRPHMPTGMRKDTWKKHSALMRLPEHPARENFRTPVAKDAAITIRTSRNLEQVHEQQVYAQKHTLESAIIKCKLFA
jgi:hypothetical protein